MLKSRTILFKTETVTNKIPDKDCAWIIFAVKRGRRISRGQIFTDLPEPREICLN